MMRGVPSFLISHGSIEDRQHFIIRKMAGKTPFHVWYEQITEAGIAEFAAGHHLMVTTACTERNKISGTDAQRLQVLPGDQFRCDAAGGRNMVGSD